MKKNKMIRKLKVFFLILITSFITSGCWNYVSLDQLTIVTGISVDMNNSNQKYHLAFEIIDLTTSNKQEGVKTTTLESEGDTIFAAIRNAKRKIKNKLYFSHAQIVLINEQIAHENNIDNVISWFLRDAEVRETINFIIVKGCHAIDILSEKGIGHPINSYEIKEIVKEDNSVTSSTIDTELFEIYNILHSEDHSLALPVFKTTSNNKEVVGESDGIAAFRDNKLLGFLSPKETKYFLFATGKVKGGILTIDAPKDAENRLSLEISKSKTQKSYSYKNNIISISLNIDVEVFLGEGEGKDHKLSEKEIETFEKQAEEKINSNVEKLIKKVQNQFSSDIFGFGQFIYQKNPKLYKRLKPNWEQLFRTIKVNVNSEVNISNTAFVK